MNRETSDSSVGQQLLELARVVGQVPGVKVTGKTGRQGSFEVSVNDKLVYSKLKTGSFPKPEEVVELVKKNMAQGGKAGKTT
ncbi:hypothetical protein PFLUV_G00034690 [Perca fluviatilis]|uniref:Selenoprotein W n=1 Tax=Perca fluviatilis TaxID=8168 RepID=A0A6A5FCU5_PERFL|nr:hypothetical protein PFLUV_G00034690 [Perca fluviatilis]